VSFQGTVVMGCTKTISVQMFSIPMQPRALLSVPRVHCLLHSDCACLHFPRVTACPVMPELTIRGHAATVEATISFPCRSVVTFEHVYLEQDATTDGSKDKCLINAICQGQQGPKAIQSIQRPHHHPYCNTLHPQQDTTMWSV